MAVLDIFVGASQENLVQDLYTFTFVTWDYFVLYKKYRFPCRNPRGIFKLTMDNLKHWEQNKYIGNISFFRVHLYLSKLWSARPLSSSLAVLSDCLKSDWSASLSSTSRVLIRGDTSWSTFRHRLRVRPVCHPRNFISKINSLGKPSVYSGQQFNFYW